MGHRNIYLCSMMDSSNDDNLSVVQLRRKNRAGGDQGGFHVDDTGVWSSSKSPSRMGAVRRPGTSFTSLALPAKHRHAVCIVHADDRLTVSAGDFSPIGHQLPATDRSDDGDDDDEIDYEFPDFGSSDDDDDLYANMVSDY